MKNIRVLKFLFLKGLECLILNVFITVTYSTHCRMMTCWLKLTKQVSTYYWCINKLGERLWNYCLKLLCLCFSYTTLFRVGHPTSSSLLSIFHCELQLSAATPGTCAWSLGCPNTWPSVRIAWCLPTTGSGPCLRAFGSRQCWFRWTRWLTLQVPSVLQEILSLCH